MTLQYPPDWNLEGIGFTVPTEAVENLLAVLGISLVDRGT